MSQKTSNASRVSIYDYDKQIERITARMETELSQQNAEVIIRYDKTMVSLSMSKAVRLLHLRILLNMSKMLVGDWKDVTKQDIDELVYKIMKKYASEKGQETNSTSDYKKILKIFFRWFKTGSRNFNEVGDPGEIKNVKIRKVRDKIIREDLFTDSDLTRLLHACKENQRDRAFIDCQAESGTRPGEMLNLLLKHVKFDNHGAILHVDGKTGTRTVRLVRSVPNLAKWLDVHPFRNNPESPLWIMLTKREHGRMMTYAGAQKIIKKRSEIAGISKRVYMNLFRHSEATKTAMFLTEAQMRKRHGWSSASRMPSKYVHLINSDVDKAILSHYGIVKNEKAEQDLPKKCNICDMMNSPESKICCKCGKPLDLSIALEMEEKERQEREDAKQTVINLQNDMNEMKSKLAVILGELASRVNKN